MISTAILLVTAAASCLLAWRVATSLRPRRVAFRFSGAQRPQRPLPVRLAAALETAEARRAAPATVTAALLHPAVPAPTTADEARIRDRYIAIRFQGLFRGAADLDDSNRVIETARHYFEDEEYDRASELLDLAIDRRPADKAMRLAQLEIAFLERNAERYLALARQLNEAIPGCPEWPEIERLGRTLMPLEQFFGAGTASGGRHAHPHYGPWPDMPNWIGASWDLAVEVRACELHQAMAAAPAPCAALPRGSR